MLRLTEREGMWIAVGRVCGKLQRKTTGIRVGGREAKERAQQRLLEIETQLRATATAAPVEPAYPTFGEWVLKYQATSARRKAPSTQERERGLIIPALRLWGTRRLDTLKPVDVEEYLALRKDARHRTRAKDPRPVSESTISREFALLTTIWNKARANFTALPALLANMKFRMPVRQRIVTMEEQVQLLQRLTPRYHPLVIVLVGSGLRLAEALGITPRDIRWEEKLIAVLGKGSKARDVPMNAGVERALRAAVAAMPPGAVYVFQHLHGRRTDAGRVGKLVTTAFAQACKARKTRPALERITPHALRHTFGHRFLTCNGNAAGSRGDIYYLSTVLGHASVSITQRHYAYLRVRDVRDVMLGIDVGVSVEQIAQWIPPAPTTDSSTSAASDVITV